MIGTGSQPALDTRSATTDSSDPLQSCTIGGSSKNARSVWFRYTPAGSGTVIINTVDSDYDTVLTAYTGSCAALSPVACDDDGAINALSRVQFGVSAGTPYLIEVTAKGSTGAGGALHLLVAQFVSSPVPTPTSQATPPVLPFNPKVVDACEKTIKKAGAKLVTTTLRSLASCGTGVSKCIQTKADPAQRDRCVQRAGDKCRKNLAKAGAARDVFEASVLKRCAAVDVADVRDGDGIGFDAVADSCDGPIDSIAAIASCIGEQHQCEAAKLFEATQPRARELMRVAGATPGAFAAVDCLTDYGGGGEDLDQEKGAGKLLDKCGKSVVKAGSSFVTKKLKNLERCVDKLFTCAVKSPGDAGCPAKASATCSRAFGAITTAEARFRAAVEKRCGGVDYDGALAPAAGGNVTALASECSSFGTGAPVTLASYVDCLARQHACRVESLLGLEAPRAGELLAGVTPPVTFPSAQCAP